MTHIILVHCYTGTGKRRVLANIDVVGPFASFKEAQDWAYSPHDYACETCCVITLMRAPFPTNGSTK